MSPQDIANLVNGVRFPNEARWSKFVVALEGKSVDELHAIDKLIVEAEDSLAMAAISFLTNQKAKLLVMEFETVTDDNWVQTAKKFGELFWRPWTVVFFKSQLERNSHILETNGAANHVLSLIYLGQEKAREFLAYFE